MAIKLKSNSAYDGQLQETNTANRNYYLPNNDSGLGTQLMTAQATTSGTNIDFNSIPSWVKRITVMFNGVSTNGTSNYLVQLGSGSVTSSGYTALGNAYNQANGTAGATSTAGFIVHVATASATAYGHMTITLVSGSTWVSSHAGYKDTNSAMSGGGSVTLSGALDRVRITTVNGTDTFDAGSINVMYE